MTRSALAACALLLGLSGAHPGQADEAYIVRSTHAAFEDVFDGLKTAIEERGMSVKSVMDIGGMLERTGKDLGITDPIYTQARSVEFCSALLSHEMTRENPARIVNCPLIMSVYQRAGESGTTYVVHRAIPRQEQEASQVMARIATLYNDLSEAATSW